ncbi:hypothetical protein B0H14DRAFT_3175399 [Mycena olivaceomarginata]|nr:hypothetical protein B0H14DRAFT_3175399 [Mycena olivaceomarginata]
MRSDDSGTTRQGLGIGVDVIRPRRARNRRLYGTYLRPFGVALPDSLRAVCQHDADAAQQRARAFAGAQGNAEAREQARLGSEKLRPAQALSPTDTPHFRTQRAAFVDQASICLSNVKRRLASVRVLDLRIPPGPPKRFGSRIATNTARHDTVDIPGRAQHTHATIEWAGPLDHRVLIDAPRHAPTITPPPVFKSRSLHACGRNLRSIRAHPPALSQRPYCAVLHMRDIIPIAAILRSCLFDGFRGSLQEAGDSLPEAAFPILSGSQIWSPPNAVFLPDATIELGVECFPRSFEERDEREPNRTFADQRARRFQVDLTRRLRSGTSGIGRGHGGVRTWNHILRLERYAGGSETWEYALGDFTVRQAAIALVKGAADVTDYAHRSMSLVNIWDASVTSDGLSAFVQRWYLCFLFLLPTSS